ncbi:MAG: hypothetical protein AB1921_12595 [Thermodesulfobacteriota bacterium]
MASGKTAFITAALGLLPSAPLGGVFRSAEIQLGFVLIFLVLFFPLLRRRKSLFLLYLSTLPYFYAIHVWQGLDDRVGANLVFWIVVLSGLVIFQAGRFDPLEEDGRRITLLGRRPLLLVVASMLAFRAYAAFGSAVYEGPMYMALGSRMILADVSPYGSPHIYPSLGPAYGPVMFLCELPFAPLAGFARQFLHSEALIPWQQIPSWASCVAQVHLSFLVFDALIMVAFAKLAGKYWLEAAAAWVLNPVTGLFMAVGASEIPQTGLLLWAFALRSDAASSAVLTSLAVLTKGYSILLVPFWGLFREGRSRIRFLQYCIAIIGTGLALWAAWTWLSRPPGTMSPSEMFFYASGHNYGSSVYVPVYAALGARATNILRLGGVFLLLAQAYRLARKDGFRRNLCMATLLVLSAPILYTPYLHPGHMYSFLIFITAFGFFLTLGSRQGDGDVRGPASGPDE